MFQNRPFTDKNDKLIALSVLRLCYNNYWRKRVWICQLSFHIFLVLNSEKVFFCSSWARIEFLFLCAKKRVVVPHNNRSHLCV